MVKSAAANQDNIETDTQTLNDQISEHKDLPKSVKLSAPYGFIDDNNRLFFWEVDQVVDNPKEIKTLIDRSAPLITVE